MFQTTVVEKSEKHILCSFFRQSCLFEIMWENIVDPDRQPMTIWHMCTACWIPKAEDTHSGYVTFYLLLFHGNNICTNLTQCYVIRTFLSRYCVTFSQYYKSLNG